MNWAIIDYGPLPGQHQIHYRCSVQYLCKHFSFPGIYINKLTLYYDAIISGQRPIRG